MKMQIFICSCFIITILETYGEIRNANQFYLNKALKNHPKFMKHESGLSNIDEVMKELHLSNDLLMQEFIGYSKGEGISGLSNEEGVFSEKEEEHHEDMTFVELPAMDEGVKSTPIRLNFHQHNQQEVMKNRAVANIRMVMTTAQCRRPLRRCIDVNVNQTVTGKHYWPGCAVIWRCGGDAGCCYSTEQECVAKESHLVDLYFLYASTTTRAGVDVLTFINDTSCHCQNKVQRPETTTISTTTTTTTSFTTTSAPLTTEVTSGPTTQDTTIDSMQRSTPSQSYTNESIVSHLPSNNISVETGSVSSDSSSTNSHFESPLITQNELKMRSNEINDSPSLVESNKVIKASSINSLAKSFTEYELERLEPPPGKHTEADLEVSNSRTPQRSPSFPRAAVSLQTEEKTGEKDAQETLVKAHESYKSKVIASASCQCPEGFEASAVRGSSFPCICVCDPARKTCRKIMGGRKYFPPQDEKCITSGQCSLPRCKFGSFLTNLRRCPRKKESRRARRRKRNRGRRHSRRRIHNARSRRWHQNGARTRLV